MKGFMKISSKIDKEFVRFLIKLTLFLSAYYVFIGLKISTFAIDFLSKITAIKANFLLNLFEINSSCVNSILYCESYSIKVAFGCEGSEPIALMISTILASKSNFKMRSLGILAGTLLLSSWNDLRVFLLFVIGKNYNEYFDVMHNDVLPFLSVVLSLSIYFVWLKLNKKLL